MKADVLVIGGGPAGTATAIQCAQGGLEVILVERELFPRAHPGETLHPGVEPLLGQLGVLEKVVAAGFLRHAGHWVQWNSPMRFEAFGQDQHGPWLGFQAWRAEFDAILLGRAHEAGVQILQPCRALGPLLEQQRIGGARTTAGVIQAAFVVDATGDRHWGARQLGLPIERHSPRLIAHYGYAAGTCPVRDEAPAIVGDERGWTWTARVRPAVYGWTRMDLQQAASSQWIPQEFEQLQPIGKARGADVSWRIVPSTAGPGYFLVGDAAAVLDPASSHGVLRAIMSGIFAAHAIMQVVHQRVGEQQAARAYTEWVRNWFEADERRLRELYVGLESGN
jgi:flavin-dependent dehydrogenase